MTTTTLRAQYRADRLLRHIEHARAAVAIKRPVAASGLDTTGSVRMITRAIIDEGGVTIRHDHEEHLDFWHETYLTERRLRDWLAEIQIEQNEAMRRRPEYDPFGGFCEFCGPEGGPCAVCGREDHPSLTVQERQR